MKDRGMKVVEAREREFKRVRREESSDVRRADPAQRWDGVSGVYTVRPRRDGTPGDEAHPEASRDEVVGVACEPIS